MARDRGIHLAKELIAAAGLTADEISVTKKSAVRAIVRAPDGRTELQFFPGTPSDWRGRHNKLALLRRFREGPTQ
jgi:CelD/BcsL family acetyltransferase involved in cellulose biosynthesis